MRRRAANHSRTPRDAFGRRDQFASHPDALRHRAAHRTRAPRHQMRHRFTATSSITCWSQSLPIRRPEFPMIRRSPTRSASASPRAARMSSTTCRCTWSPISIKWLWSVRNRRAGAERRGHSRLAASACAWPRQPAQRDPQRARVDRPELTSSSAR